MKRAAALALLLAATGCRVEVGARGDDAGAGGEQTVHVYTSIYQDVTEAIDPALAARLAKTAPGVHVEWFSSGSEKVAARLDAELAAGGSPCDVLVTSDPGYYAKLKADGRLVPYVSPAALRQPRAFVDPDGDWAASRLSTMVIGLSLAEAKRADRPASFRDLAKAGTRISIGDPLASGTNFTTVSTLSDRFGWDFYRALKAKGTIASGGSPAVIQRLESGESDAGIVLLENLLLANDAGNGLGVVIPSDGAVIIPGPIALMTHARHSEAARAVYDAFLSDEVQAVIVGKGKMHSPDPAVTPPPGAPALDTLLPAALPSAKQPADVVKSTFDGIFFK